MIFGYAAYARNLEGSKPSHCGNVEAGDGEDALRSISSIDEALRRRAL
jgi:hypothetical protein